MNITPVTNHHKWLKEFVLKMYRNNYDTFHSLFIKWDCVCVNDLDLDIKWVTDSNIFLLEGNEIRSNFRVSVVYDTVIFTDFPSYTWSDRVWYLLEDETLLFARNIWNCNDKNVLDIWTWSWVLAIMSKINWAKSVTAIDISERAICMWKFNAELNDCNDIDFRLVDFKDFKSDTPYDYITFNPPFVPVPDESKYMLSGAGWLDGLSLFHILMDKLHELAHSMSSIDIISMSPWNSYISRIEEIFIDNFRGRNYKILSTDIYQTTASIDVVYSPFKEEKWFDTWKKYLKDHNYDFMHYLFVRVFPHTAFSYERVNLVPKLEIDDNSWNWEAMYHVIHNSRKHAQ